MRGTGWVALGMVLVMMLPLASADLTSRVELEHQGTLSDTDLGITVGAISPSGEDVLIGGLNGYARLLSASQADDRSMDVELVWDATPPSTTSHGTLEATRRCWSETTVWR